METSDVKVMRLRRDGECACGAVVRQGERAGWHRLARVVLCETCLEPRAQEATVRDVAPVVVDIGVPGGSLEREHARRRRRDEERLRAAHPRIGGLLWRLREPRRSTAAFAKGAEGERHVAALLEKHLGDDLLVLYNRGRGAGVRGDIDVIVVAPSGVWIIDPKLYRGRRVRQARRGDDLVVDGRRRPHLMDSMRIQRTLVTDAVAAGPVDAPVAAAFCFVAADLPMFGTIEIDGVEVLTPRGVIKRLRRPGPLTRDEQVRLHADLAARFPPA